MNDDNRGKATARAKKLLALIGDAAATENEVFEASAALQRLLKESGMTVEDAEAAAGGAEIVETVVLDMPRLEPWHAGVLNTVARAYRCKVFSEPYRDGWTVDGRQKNRIRFKFLGYRDDAELAKSVFTATCAAAANCWKGESRRLTEEARERVYDDDPIAKQYVRSHARSGRRPFMIGFAHGLDRAYDENVATDSELALAVTVPSAVAERYKEITCDGGGRRANFSCPRNESFKHGMNDGYGFGRGERLCA